MTDLKTSILDAKYIDMIGLADFVVRDCGLPDTDAEGNFLPQANEIAASIFRWAAEVQAQKIQGAAAPDVKSNPDASAVAEAVAEEVRAGAEGETDQDDRKISVREYDEHGDPILDVEEAERLEAAREAVKEESA